jgi:hypothetical protein
VFEDETPIGFLKFLSELACFLKGRVHVYIVDVA